MKRSDTICDTWGAGSLKVSPEVVLCIDNYQQATVESTLRILSFVGYSQGVENLLARQRGNHPPRVGGLSPRSAAGVRHGHVMLFVA